MTGSSALERAAPLAFGLVVLCSLLATVEFAIHAGLLSRAIIPFPSEVAGAFPRIIAEERLLPRLAMTAGEALAATILLIVVGVSIGLLMHRLNLLRLATETWVAAMAAAPLVLLYPLFLVVFGRNPLTIVMIGTATALPPVILKTIEALSATPKTLVNVGRALNMSDAAIYWKIRLPSALPGIFVGIRIGMMFAMINVVGVEFLINFGGLGQLVSELSERYDLAGMYAVICFVMLICIALFASIERVEKWLRP